LKLAVTSVFAVVLLKLHWYCFRALRLDTCGSQTLAAPLQIPDAQGSKNVGK
jgi:hypothetical protein